MANSPFKIVVADYGQTIRGIFYSFLFSICVTTALLSCLLFFLYRFLHRLFFTHGMGLASGAGKITITAKVEDTAIAIAVSDSGRGMDAPMLRELRDKIAKAPQLPWSDIGLEHIALPNIQKRVAFQFGEQYGLTVQSALGQGTTVTLRLPKKT